MDIRKFVREILLEIATGTEYETYFKNRVYDRLKSPYTDFTKEPEVLKNEILNKIEYIKNVTFTGQDNIGILLHRSSKYYLYSNPNKKDARGLPEKSEGNNIWVVVRGNDLRTLYFMSDGKKPQNIKHHFTFEKLKGYIENVKNGKLILKTGDLPNIIKYNEQNKSNIKQPINPENVLTIKGEKWFVDAPSEQIYRVDNQEEKFDAYEFAETQEPEIQDKIMQILIKEIFESHLI